VIFFRLPRLTKNHDTTTKTATDQTSWLSDWLKPPQIKDVTLSSSFPPNQYHYSDITSLDDSVKKSITAKNFFVEKNVHFYSVGERGYLHFAYKTELSWWIFALAGLLALSIVLVTVSWQSWRAATRNPVEALRYE
jgi:hypothetical protein